MAQPLAAVESPASSLAFQFPFLAEAAVEVRIAQVRMDDVDLNHSIRKRTCSLRTRALPGAAGGGLYSIVALTRCRSMLTVTHLTVPFWTSSDSSSGRS